MCSSDLGSFRYNSEIPLTPTVSIGNAVARKGNAGTSDGQVTIGLSKPSTTPISVHFSTADGTAIQGRDYLATAGDKVNQPRVADGASELLKDIFGAARMSTRLVVGAASIPLGLPVVVDLLFEVEK